MLTSAERDTERATRLRQAVTRLARRLRQQAPEGISPSQLSALVAIEAGGPLTLKDLAAVERVRPPTMTRIVAALEDAGLVSRSVDTKDRRCVHVKLTNDGRKLLTRTRGRTTAYLEDRFAGLSRADRETLAAAIPILERFVGDEG
jgi:DNA-binding MarR family transcriptional regulator